jgi:hypothetical protein
MFTADIDWHPDWPLALALIVALLLILGLTHPAEEVATNGTNEHE